MVVLLMFAVLLMLLAINVPIAIALAVTTIIAMVSANGTSFLIDAAIVMSAAATCVAVAGRRHSSRGWRACHGSNSSR